MAGAFGDVASAAMVTAGTTPAPGAFEAAAFFDRASVCATAALSGRGSAVAMSAGCEGRPTAINIAAPMTQITNRRTAHAPIAPLKRVDFFTRADFFKRTVCFMRIDVLLRGMLGTSSVESKWGARPRLAMAGCNAW
ncbi:MAG: hypothetical protein DMF96_31010 [Acidobacteria bacterium]|nr:MAG: hypothetical protein DMF96_31010 [Acidobacteriota bacterium]